MKISRAADVFYARRREGPCRFIQNRSRTSVGALKSDAAAEKSKDQRSRDFLGCSIFDFCNNICHKQTSDQREPDPECRAAVIPIFCGNQPLVRHNDGVCDGQPHTHAIRLGGEERFEDLFKFVFGDARAAIRHG